MIYLDNSSTTKPNHEVLNVYEQTSSRYFGNPSSLHRYGAETEQLLQAAKNQIKRALGLKNYDIVFTSGATEANNVALKGAALSKIKTGKHIIATSIEHPSVTESLEQLTELFGFEVTYLSVNEDGFVSIKDLKDAIRPDTVLVSMMHVNNEVGSVQPIEEAGEVLKQYPNILFHVDYVQGIFKVPLAIENAGIDLCSISGHKFHGLKGTGALFVKEGTRLIPLITGGTQQKGIRAGTEHTAGAVSLAKAINLASDDYHHHLERMVAAKELFMKKLSDSDGVVLNTPQSNSAPHIINFSVPGIKAEVLLHMLEEKDIFVSTTSACSAKEHKPSKVLLQMGKGEQIAGSSIRISLNYSQTSDVTEPFMNALVPGIKKLKKMMR
ncbi:cysteine desulfurase family protein [Bacillus mojavensis]|jgi:cysteine desulfurase|uniref:Cysteine desulfurase associated with tRNA 4-thiouridine synthase n=1 Tax=Bacillus mojavensis TaxID=72360 RepID=A0ABX6M0U4_BACMO|nr:cysteine desulfurase family protein [Bacillus mojavensis]QJC97298.1 Cysteine desulfurase associated with tRNA 4-thiouridine synthase [Bacillus mojavensis]